MGTTNLCCITTEARHSPDPVLASTNSMKFSLATALVLLVATTCFVTSAPQQNRNQQRRRNQPNRQRGGASKLTGDLNDVGKDTRIEDIDRAAVNKLMRNEKSVNQLTACFKNLAKCRNPGARQMIEQMNTIGTGNGCKNCSPAKIKQRNDAIFYFLKQFQERYPTQYRSVISEIPGILARLRG